MKPLRFGILLSTLVFTMSVHAQSWLTNGLVAYYPFDGDAKDVSGNGNNGVPIGVGLGTNRFGEAANGYQFTNPGVSNVILVESLAPANLTELTLSAWINVAAAPPQNENAYIIDKWRTFSYSLEDYGLYLNSRLNVVLANGRHGTGYYALPNHCFVTTTNQLSFGEWYHIAATLDSAGTGRIYVNGILWAEDNILQLMPPAGEPVRIGQELLYNGLIENGFDGLIDDVRFYGRALPTSEVNQLYLIETMPNPPSISSQPHDAYVNAGDTVVFSVEAAGAQPLWYQWSLNGTPLAGATSSSLTVSNVTQSDLGNYSVLVTNDFGSLTSSNALLAMYPFIDMPFGGAVVYWGQDVLLAVHAIGTAPLSYQWFKDGAALLGATNQTLALAGIQFTNAGLYTVVVSNAFGSATNTPAQVVVNPAGVSLGLYPGVTVSGTVGYTYIIQSNADLTNTNGWTTVATLTLIVPVQLWVDVTTNASLPANSHRFYRVLPAL